MRPRRLRRQAGRHARVDAIPFTLPVASHETPALLAAFPVDREAAAELLPGNEVHPLALPGGRALLLVSVIDYRSTNIGRYIEYSLAIACTHGSRPAPPLLPGLPLVQRLFGTGQFVVDLPVSTEISVKGGKGIWGMPKHRANLDFVIGPRTVSSQYDLDGQLCVRVEVDRPRFERLPVSLGASNYCAFRGMLMKSSVYFSARAGFNLPLSRSARLEVGTHPRVERLRRLEPSARPLFCGYLPETHGVLDDHVESWFLSSAGEPPATEGLESVVELGQGREWPPPPDDPALELPDIEVAEP